MPDVGVESGGDKTVLWVNGEVESEELAKSLEAIETNVSAEDDSNDTDDKEGSNVDVMSLG